MNKNSKAIIDYLKKTNRPYSAIDISNNLSQEKIPKTQVVKLLNQLVESGEIHGKQYGKQWVYVAKQDVLPAPTQHEIDEMDNQLNQLKESLTASQQQNKILSSELAQLNQSLTDEQLHENIKSLEKQNEELATRLKSLQEGTIQISIKEKTEIENQYQVMRGHWKQRKKLFKNAWDLIVENIPGSATEFAEKLGIETDEAVGVDISKVNLREMKRNRPKPILHLSPITLSTHSNSDGRSVFGEESPSSILAQPMDDLTIPKDLKIDVQLQDLQILQELGAGNGGTVHKVLHVNSNTIMALKIIQVEAKNSIRKQILRELQILHACNSPFIIGYYGAFLNGPDISICMEFMNCGALDSILKRTGAFPEIIVAKIAFSVLNGLVYLFEKHRIIHRDIKPSNILVNSNGEIKMADFGVSGELTASVANTFVGTSAYMSPERIQGLKYSVQCDVWSLGLTLVELITGKFPFACDDKQLSVFELLQFIVNEKTPIPPPGIYSTEFDNFISKSLIKDHSSRPTPEQLLNDPFIRRSETLDVNLKEWASHLC